jgi:hypothetical protein
VLDANQSSAELWLFRVLLKTYLSNLEVDAYLR